MWEGVRPGKPGPLTPLGFGEPSAIIAVSAGGVLAAYPVAAARAR